MKKFDLGFYCLGNGITVCNRAVQESGDYKTVAHISEGGNIKLYVSENYIPLEAMEEIKQQAAQQQKQFREQFEKSPNIEQYRKILDYMYFYRFGDREFEKINDVHNRPFEERFPEVKSYFYSVV